MESTGNNGGKRNRNGKTLPGVKMVLCAALISLVCVSGLSVKAFATATYWELQEDGTTLARVATESEAKEAVKLMSGMCNVSGTGAEDMAAADIVSEVTVVRKEYAAYNSPDFLSAEKAAEEASGTVMDEAAETVSLKAARKKAAEGKAEKTKAAKEKAAREKAEKEKVAAEKAAQEKAAREKAAAEKAAAEKAARERAAAEKAAAEKAAQEKNAADKASEKKDDSSVNENEAAKPSVRGQEIADYARRFKGGRYVYGGADLKTGVDCSGFTMRIYEKFGIKLPHGALAQAAYGRAAGNRASDALPGDLIIFSKGHCGIAIGNGRMIHASAPNTGIIETSISYSGRIKTIRRFF